MSNCRICLYAVSVLCSRRLTVCLPVHNNCRFACSVSLARCNNIVKNSSSNNRTVRGESSWLGCESTSCRQSTCQTKESHGSNTTNSKSCGRTHTVVSFLSVAIGVRMLQPWMTYDMRLVRLQQTIVRRSSEPLYDSTVQYYRYCTVGNLFQYFLLQFVGMDTVHNPLTSYSRKF